MEIRRGIPVAPGIAFGEAFLVDSEGYVIPERHIQAKQADAEIERLHHAVEDSKAEIDTLQDRVTSKLGPEVGEIFLGHLKLLEDEHLWNECVERIREKSFSPEYAVSRVLRRLIKAFRQINDDYFSHRVSDIYDIERRILRNLLGEKREQLNRLDHEVVVVAKDLTPSQTANLDTDKVRGFATDVGGRTSHTAIVARALGIPAVVGLETVSTDLSGGDPVIIDGNHGLVIINPDEQTLEEYRERDRSFHQFEANLVEELKDLPAVTTDGLEVQLYGNIEFPREIAASLYYGVEGIGLYRTEFLYIAAEKPPTEQDHFEAYSQALHELDGRPLVLRTVDLGADKFAVFNGEPVHEANPILGCRSLRYCFRHLDLFKTQLRAILRASAFGKARVLFPLVTSVAELRQAKGIVEGVMADLDREGIPFDKDIPIGIMIEVPSAALMADVLAQECDFFSIGTNDLIQYALAVDRGNERVAHLYSPAHPAILRLIKMAVDAGAAHNVPVSLCGEMGGEFVYTILLIGLGITEFSVAPPAIVPEMKKIIRSISHEEARQIASSALELADSTELMEFLSNRTRDILPEAF